MNILIGYWVIFDGKTNDFDHFKEKIYINGYGLFISIQYIESPMFNSKSNDKMGTTQAF